MSAAQHYRRTIKIKQYARELSRLGKGTAFRASLKIGVFGGSFNPIHQGHIAIAKYASERLLLGRVIWVLAQDSHANEKKLGNKNLDECKNIQTTFNERFARAQKVLEGWHRGRDGDRDEGRDEGFDAGTNSKISANINSKISSEISATISAKISSCQSLSPIEKKFNIAYSHQLAEALRRAFPRVKLVFLLGADSFAQFKRWKKWRKLAKSINLAVFSREGASLRARLNSSARMLPRVKHGRHAGRKIAEAKVARWVFVSMRDVTIASRNIRGGGASGGRSGNSKN